MKFNCSTTKFKHWLKNKKVLVYGLSISGEWASRLLVKHKAKVFLFDDDAAKLHTRRIKNCYILPKIDDDILNDLDLMIVSPAIEKTNQYLSAAQAKNKPVMSEVELASHFAKHILAITGTNGKTTSVELVAELLNQKYKSVACGNNGYPFSRAVIEGKNRIMVVEVSSFMLENCQTFHPNIASILNIKPDHLIRHKTMSEYAKLKHNIFNNLTAKDWAVVNLDSNIHPTQNCRIMTYSYSRLADVYYYKGAIFHRQQKIVDVNRLQIKGKHNVLNAMCAICYALICKLSIKQIRQALVNFQPKEFRNSLIAEINGVRFINDSKSTNIASTIASIDAVDGAVILLLGGSAKGLNYTPFFAHLSKKVKQIVAYGEIAPALERANTQADFAKFKNLEQAFNCAVSKAKPGDTVLFSPSSASYDQFENYIERGKAFNNLVADYGKAKQE